MRDPYERKIMHFVVDKHYGQEVEVKLHWQTKDKIKRSLYQVVIWTVAILIWLHIFKTRDKKDQK